MMMIVMIRMMIRMKNLVHHERDVVVLADLRQPSEERWRPVVVATLGLERLPGYQECLKNTCIRHIRSTQVFTNTYYRRSHFQHTVTHSKTLADNHNTHTPGLVLRSHQPQVVPQRWTVQGSPQRAQGSARPQLRSRARSPRAGTCRRGSLPWASSGWGCRLPGLDASSSRRGDPRCARGTRP